MAKTLRDDGGLDRDVAERASEQIDRELTPGACERAASPPEPESTPIDERPPVASVDERAAKEQLARAAERPPVASVDERAAKEQLARAAERPPVASVDERAAKQKQELAAETDFDVRRAQAEGKRDVALAQATVRHRQDLSNAKTHRQQRAVHHEFSQAVLQAHGECDVEIARAKSERDVRLAALGSRRPDAARSEIRPSVHAGARQYLPFYDADKERICPHQLARCFEAAGAHPLIARAAAHMISQHFQAPRASPADFYRPYWNMMGGFGRSVDLDLMGAAFRPRTGGAELAREVDAQRRRAMQGWSSGPMRSSIAAGSTAKAAPGPDPRLELAGNLDEISSVLERGELRSGQDAEADRRLRKVLDENRGRIEVLTPGSPAARIAEARARLQAAAHSAGY
jgi:hypothetical protein